MLPSNGMWDQRRHQCRPCIIELDDTKCLHLGTWSECVAFQKQHVYNMSTCKNYILDLKESPDISRHKTTTSIEWSRPSCFLHVSFQLSLETMASSQSIYLRGASSWLVDHLAVPDSRNRHLVAPGSSLILSLSTVRVLVADFFPHRKHQPQVTNVYNN